MAHVVCVLGTRPEAVKMAPVVHALRRGGVPVQVLSTGQHRELLQQVLPWLSLEVDSELGLMSPGESLGSQLGRMIHALDQVLARWQPAAVLVQGDTTTAWATAQVCFYRQIPLGHVEAGLRTGALAEPFPEEFHRRGIALAARWHFAPTSQARENLLAEGVPAECIFVTGNTVIDALRQMDLAQLPDPLGLGEDEPLVLVTLHRREQLRRRLDETIRAVRRLLDQEPQAVLAWVGHPHPGIQQRLQQQLPAHPRLFRLEPLEYPVFLGLLARARVVWTDSGGVQEEAAALGRPCLVLRNRTERTEGLTSGAARLVGTCPKSLLEQTRPLLHDPHKWQQMAAAPCPYGDGRAAERIAEVLRAELNRKPSGFPSGRSSRRQAG